MAIINEKFSATFDSGLEQVGGLIDSDPNDRILAIKAKGLKVGYHKIHLDYNGTSSKDVEILVTPKIGQHFILNKIGDKDEFTEAGVGVVGVTVESTFHEGPVDPGDALKWKGGTVLLVVNVSCEYVKPLPDGTYKYSIWVRGVSVVVRTVYVTIKNTEVQGVSYE